jgi:glycosyltransferase involved in cell wall biosynthesis
MEPDISIIIASYNRARDLSRTLEGMTKLRNEGFAFEVVVVDNNSVDRTKAVVESFSGRLPLRYLFEARNGKNRALNAALDKVRLGKIVVFTDDDVDVSPDWLVSIQSVCDRWPDYSVFGGRINVVFPVDRVPKWAFDPLLSAFAFSRHHYSDTECIYGDREIPFGPNFWVKREVFNGGRRFNEEIGPHPTNSIMGSETSFVLDLLRDGYKIVYSPAAVVGHRIQTQILKSSAIFWRAYRQGRGMPHLFGLPQSGHLSEWSLYRYGAIVWNALKVPVSLAFSSNEMRSVNYMRRLRILGYLVGYQVEVNRLAKRTSPPSRRINEKGAVN